MLLASMIMQLLTWMNNSPRSRQEMMTNLQISRALASYFSPLVISLTLTCYLREVKITKTSAHSLMSNTSSTTLVAAISFSTEKEGIRAQSSLME